MNILFLTRLYYPHIGGVEKHVEKISQELIKLGHKITIVTEQYDKQLKKTDTHQDVTIYRIPVLKSTEKSKKWIIWRWLWQNRQLIKSADIIHIHDVFFWFLPFRFIFPLKKVFITFHGYEGSNLPKCTAVVQRKVAEVLSSGSICVGEFMEKWYYARPKLITYGAANIKPQPLPHQKTAIFIGRLDQDTGIMAYLKALKLLKEQSISLPLIVYGDGPYYQRAKQFCHQHHLPVKFKGFTTQADLKIKHYRFAFVSRYLSILEAMQTKRLVFAHYNNKIKYDYNNKIKYDYLVCHPQAKNMLIFNAPQQLATAIKKLLKTPTKEIKTITAASRWASQQTWTKLTRQYLKLWQ